MAIVLLCSCCPATLKVVDAKGVENVLSIAKENGWISTGRGWTCPKHSTIPSRTLIEMPRRELQKQ